jgi:hypothetical protein
MIAANTAATCIKNKTPNSNSKQPHGHSNLQALAVRAATPEVAHEKVVQGREVRIALLQGVQRDRVRNGLQRGDDRHRQDSSGQPRAHEHACMGRNRQETLQQ